MKSLVLILVILFSIAKRLLTAESKASSEPNRFNVLIIDEYKDNKLINPTSEQISLTGLDLVGFTDFDTFLTTNETQIVGDMKNESSFFYFRMGDLSKFALATKKLKRFTHLCQMQVQVLLAVNSSGHIGIGNKSLNLESVLSTLKTIILNSKFYQTSPLILQIGSPRSEKCIIGYRPDVLHEEAIVKIIRNYVCDDWDIREMSERISLNFNGIPLVVVGVNFLFYEYDTEILMGSDNCGGSKQICFGNGFAVDVLKNMQVTLNFSIQPYTTNDWGTYNSKTKQWRGAVADISQGKADLSISSTAAVTERASQVDFNVGTNRITIAVFFKKVEAATKYNYALLAPFSVDLWVVVGLWILVNWFIYWTFTKPKPIVKDELCEDLTTDSQEPSHLGNIFSLSFNPICQRGCSWIPTSYSIRAHYYMQLMAGLIIYTAYSGTLISFLSVEQNPIDSLSMLVSDRFSFDFGVVDYPITRQYLQVDGCQDPVIYHILKRSLVPGTKDVFKRVSIHPFEKVLNGFYGYVVDDKSGFIDLQDLNPTDACDVQVLSIPGSTQSQGTFVKKYSKIKKVIDYSIIRQTETGNVAALKRRYLPKKIECNKSKPFTEVGLDDLQVAYFVLKAAISFSAIAFIAELVYSWAVFKYKMFKLMQFGWIN